ncbi:DUF732 domain-containing protein, partial [Mycobacterium avium subsp. hominissuis]|nr:DUF732 domain-containing protein [Mycobacterium avium subsp. hominissuis]
FTGSAFLTRTDCCVENINLSSSEGTFLVTTPGQRARSSVDSGLDAGPPTSAESAFIQSVRGHVPGRDTDLLVVGRTVCKMGSDSGRYVRQQVAQRLGTDTANAGQVMDAAEEYICPGVAWR